MLMFHKADSLTHAIYRLEPYKGAIKYRYDLYKEQLDNIDKHEGGLEKFSRGYESRGFIVDEKNGVTYKEWAPGAVEARLIGDFSKTPWLEAAVTLDPDSVTHF